MSARAISVVAFRAIPVLPHASGYRRRGHIRLRLQRFVRRSRRLDVRTLRFLRGDSGPPRGGAGRSAIQSAAAAAIPAAGASQRHAVRGRAKGAIFLLSAVRSCRRWGADLGCSQLAAETFDLRLAERLLAAHRQHR